MRIQQINWLTRARKAAGAKGPAQAELLDDLGQSVTVADLTPYEYDFLGGVKRMVGSVNVALNAANPSQVTLLNPANSGVLALIDGYELTTATAVTSTDNWGTQELATAIFTPQHLDTRWGNIPPAVANDISSMLLRATSTVGAVAFNIISRIVTQAGVPLFVPRSLVLSPGFVWSFITPINTAITAMNIFWRERPAESGELSLGS